MIGSDFRKDGFAVAAAALPSDELDTVAADIHEVFARRALELGLIVPEAVGQAALSQLLLDLFTRQPESYLSSARLTQYLISVHRLGVAPALTRLLAEVGISVPSQSTRPVIHFMADGLRVQGGYHRTPAHQDWRSVQGSLDGVTLWIPLYDVGASDYPIEVVPGSHRRGLLPSVDDVFGHRLAEGEVHEKDFKPLLVRRGDVVVFSGFLVHRTSAKGRELARVALSYRFNNAADPSYVARNYPMPYAYRADMRLLLERFPSEADVAAYFAP